MHLCHDKLNALDRRHPKQKLSQSIARLHLNDQIIIIIKMTLIAVLMTTATATVLAVIIPTDDLHAVKQNVIRHPVADDPKTKTPAETRTATLDETATETLADGDHRQPETVLQNQPMKVHHHLEVDS